VWSVEGRVYFCSVKEFSTCSPYVSEWTIYDKSLNATKIPRQSIPRLLRPIVIVPWIHSQRFFDMMRLKSILIESIWSHLTLNSLHTYNKMETRTHASFASSLLSAVRLRDLCMRESVSTLNTSSQDSGCGVSRPLRSPRIDGGGWYNSPVQYSRNLLNCSNATALTSASRVCRAETHALQCRCDDVSITVCYRNPPHQFTRSKKNWTRGGNNTSVSAAIFLTRSTYTHTFLYLDRQCVSHE